MDERIAHQKTPVVRLEGESVPEMQVVVGEADALHT
jgi:hypothetical protein